MKSNGKEAFKKDTVTWKRTQFSLKSSLKSVEDNIQKMVQTEYMVYLLHLLI
jgi:hypothetical protein